MLDLEASFIRLWPDKEMARRQWSALKSIYEERERHYHTLQHLRECLEEPEIDAGPIDDTAVKLAIFYHDAVMIFVRDESRYSNEELSAMMLLEHAEMQWIDKLDGDINLASKMIDETENHGMPRTFHHPDVDLMLDIDLGILGRDQARFDEYEAQIRREYSVYPDATFYPARARVLRNFLELPAIYVTPSIKERYEEKARANLQRSLATIESRSSSKVKRHD